MGGIDEWIRETPVNPERFLQQRVTGGPTASPYTPARSGVSSNFSEGELRSGRLALPVRSPLARYRPKPSLSPFRSLAGTPAPFRPRSVQGSPNSTTSAGNDVYALSQPARSSSPAPRDALGAQSLHVPSRASPEVLLSLNVSGVECLSDSSAAARGSDVEGVLSPARPATPSAIVFDERENAQPAEVEVDVPLPALPVVMSVFSGMGGRAQQPLAGSGRETGSSDNPTPGREEDACRRNGVDADEVEVQVQLRDSTDASTTRTHTDDGLPSPAVDTAEDYGNDQDIAGASCSSSGSEFDVIPAAAVVAHMTSSPAQPPLLMERNSTGAGRHPTERTESVACAGSVPAREGLVGAVASKHDVDSTYAGGSTSGAAAAESSTALAATIVSDDGADQWSDKMELEAQRRSSVVVVDGVVEGVRDTGSTGEGTDTSAGRASATAVAKADILSPFRGDRDCFRSPMPAVVFPQGHDGGDEDDSPLFSGVHDLNSQHKHPSAPPGVCRDDNNTTSSVNISAPSPSESPHHLTTHVKQRDDLDNVTMSISDVTTPTHATGVDRETVVSTIRHAPCTPVRQASFTSTPQTTPSGVPAEADTDNGNDEPPCTSSPMPPFGSTAKPHDAQGMGPQLQVAASEECSMHSERDTMRGREEKATGEDDPRCVAGDRGVDIGGDGRRGPKSPTSPLPARSPARGGGRNLEALEDEEGGEKRRGPGDWGPGIDDVDCEVMENSIVGQGTVTLGGTPYTGDITAASDHPAVSLQDAQSQAAQAAHASDTATIRSRHSQCDAADIVVDTTLPFVAIAATCAVCLAAATAAAYVSVAPAAVDADATPAPNAVVLPRRVSAIDVLVSSGNSPTSGALNGLERVTAAQQVMNDDAMSGHIEGAAQRCVEGGMPQEDAPVMQHPAVSDFRIGGGGIAAPRHAWDGDSSSSAAVTATDTAAARSCDERNGAAGAAAADVHGEEGRTYEATAVTTGTPLAARARRPSAVEILVQSRNQASGDAKLVSLDRVVDAQLVTQDDVTHVLPPGVSAMAVFVAVCIAAAAALSADEDASASPTTAGGAMRILLSNSRHRLPSLDLLVGAGDGLPSPRSPAAVGKHPSVAGRVLDSPGRMTRGPAHDSEDGSVQTSPQSPQDTGLRRPPSKFAPLGSKPGSPAYPGDAGSGYGHQISSNAGEGRLGGVTPRLSSGQQTFDHGRAMTVGDNLVSPVSSHGGRSAFGSVRSTFGSVRTAMRGWTDAQFEEALALVVEAERSMRRMIESCFEVVAAQWGGANSGLMTEDVDFPDISHLQQGSTVEDYAHELFDSMMRVAGVTNFASSGFSDSGLVLSFMNESSGQDRRGRDKGGEQTSLSFWISEDTAPVTITPRLSAPCPDSSVVVTDADATDANTRNSRGEGTEVQAAAPVEEGMVVEAVLTPPAAAVNDSTESDDDGIHDPFAANHVESASVEKSLPPTPPPFPPPTPDGGGVHAGGRVEVESRGSRATGSRDGSGVGTRDASSDDKVVVQVGPIEGGGVESVRHLPQTSVNPLSLGAASAVESSVVSRGRPSGKRPASLPQKLARLPGVLKALPRDLHALAHAVGSVYVSEYPVSRARFVALTVPLFLVIIVAVLVLFDINPYYVALIPVIVLIWLAVLYRFAYGWVLYYSDDDLEVYIHRQHVFPCLAATHMVPYDDLLFQYDLESDAKIVLRVAWPSAPDIPLYVPRSFVVAITRSTDEKVWWSRFIESRKKKSGFLANIKRIRSGASARGGSAPHALESPRKPPTNRCSCDDVDDSSTDEEETSSDDDDDEDGAPLAHTGRHV